MAESRAQLLASLEHNLKFQERLYEIEVAGYKKEPASVQLRVMLEQLEIKYGIKMDTASRRDAWFKFLSSPNAHADRLMREIVSAAYNTSSQDWDRLDSARKQLMTTEVATEIANLYSELSKDVHGRSSPGSTSIRELIRLALLCCQLDLYLSGLQRTAAPGSIRELLRLGLLCCQLDLYLSGLQRTAAPGSFRVHIRELVIGLLCCHLDLWLQRAAAPGSFRVHIRELVRLALLRFRRKV